MSVGRVGKFLWPLRTAFVMLNIIPFPEACLLFASELFIMNIYDENISDDDLMGYLENLIRIKKRENSALRNLLSIIDHNDLRNKSNTDDKKNYKEDIDSNSD